VYKYIRGVVGSITDPSGMDPTVHSNADVAKVVGAFRAKYLDVHGYREGTVEMILDAYKSASTAEQFVDLAKGCGMSVVELEWFWELTWRF